MMKQLEFIENDHHISKSNQQVTVLGITFANGEERRTYFREELRKQLPELKKIEGFPIGEDDDILNLSDPPYYTACPNPWINDFIAEWETEKAELENQGKRISAFKVDEPYASDVSEGKNNPIYNAHSYHTKVPHPAIMRYILHYTQPGDIVFDGFAGTGMTGVAAGMCGNPDNETKERIGKEFKTVGLPKPNWGSRHAVCGDLSPIASMISYNYNNDINALQLRELIGNILNTIHSKYNWLYKTNHTNGQSATINFIVWSDMYTCSNCSSEIVFWDTAVDYEKGTVNEVFKCSNCNAEHTKRTVLDVVETIFNRKKKIIEKKKKRVAVLINYTYKGQRYLKKPDNEDIEILNKIDSYEIDNWLPFNEIIDGDEIGRLKNELIFNVSDLFPKRALIILSELLAYASIQNRLFILISAILQNTSWLYRWRANGKGGTTSGTYYICATPQENNVFNQLERKLDDLFNAFKYSSIVKGNSAIYNSSATELTISSNSIDYIFTDPPFGANIMYSELNFIWEPWLKVITNKKEEAIENRTQKKSSLNYQELMFRSFKEYYRILKNGSWMTVEFSNTNAAIWNGIQTSIQKAGFVIANVSSLDKQQGSFKAVNTVTAVKQDLVISCYKPSSEFDTKFQQSQYNEVGIWDFIDEHLMHLPVHLIKENATTAVIERSPKILFDRLIAFYVQRNLPVPIDAGMFQKELRERLIERDGMFFTPEQVLEYESKKAELPDFIQLSLLVASEQDGVMWLRRELEFSPQTYQELQPKWMQALAGVRKGDILPELRDILEDNYLQNESGAWYLPDLENEIDLEKVRTRRLLKQFDSYKEQASKPKGKIKEARVEALRIGFKQCYKEKDFKTIVSVGDCIPNNLLMEDEVLLQFYDIAISRV